MACNYLFLGASGVGKSSLISRFFEDTFTGLLFTFPLPTHSRTMIRIYPFNRVLVVNDRSSFSNANRVSQK
jgi:predicted GTPase